MKTKSIDIITIIGFLILITTFIFNTVTILKQYEDTADYIFLFQAEYTKQKKQLENCYSYLSNAKK